MNKFFKKEKLAIAIILFVLLITSMAVTVFAEGSGEAGNNYLTNPEFFRFLFVVVAFISAVVCSILIYIAVVNGKKERYYEEREGTAKLYEDLDDAKWDAPDSVFIEDMEPTAAILTDMQPVKPVKGLDGFVITEKPIDPVTAMNIGADPYAYKIGEDVENFVVESVENTPITMAEMNPPLEDSLAHEIEEPIDVYAPETSPFIYIENVQTVVPAPETPVAVAYETTVKSVVLEDSPVPVSEPAEIGVKAAAVPKSEPLSYVDVPITIVTSDDDDGVVNISATICENTVVPTVLTEELLATTAPKPEPEKPIRVAVPSPSDPMVYVSVAEEKPVEIPSTEAFVFEDGVSIVLEDEIVPVVKQPVVIPPAAAPKADIISHNIVAEETPVVIPATEAMVFEDSVAASALTEELLATTTPQPEPAAPIRVAVPSPSDPMVYVSVTEEEPVVIPTSEAIVVEDSVATTTLEDEIVIPVPETIKPATIPESEPIAEFIVTEEKPEPTSAPESKVGVIEDNVARTVLEDKKKVEREPIVKHVRVKEATTPVSEPIDSIAIAEEEPVEVPATEAMVFENTVAATVLEDEVVIPVPETIVVKEATLPRVESIAHSIVAEETPVVIPATEAAVFENTVAATVLEDEVVIHVPETITIEEATLPRAESIAHSVVAEETPVVIPATEAAVFENTVATTALEDEVVIHVPETIT
ncbi:MAG: hypothetical protein IJX58_02280, partial [Clostridia bacterium]|nr:hypothetical protein [Clostridia bacterium]